MRNRGEVVGAIRASCTSSLIGILSLAQETHNGDLMMTLLVVSLPMVHLSSPFLRSLFFWAPWFRSCLIRQFVGYPLLGLFLLCHSHFQAP